MNELIKVLKKQSWVFWFWTWVTIGIIFYVGFKFGYYKAMVNCLNAFS